MDRRSAVTCATLALRCVRCRRGAAGAVKGVGTELWAASELERVDGSELQRRASHT